MTFQTFLASRNVTIHTNDTFTKRQFLPPFLRSTSESRMWLLSLLTVLSITSQLIPQSAADKKEDIKKLCEEPLPDGQDDVSKYKGKKRGDIYKETMDRKQIDGKGLKQFIQSMDQSSGRLLESIETRAVANTVATFPVKFV